MESNSSNRESNIPKIGAMDLLSNFSDAVEKSLNCVDNRMRRLKELRLDKDKHKKIRKGINDFEIILKDLDHLMTSSNRTNLAITMYDIGNIKEILDLLEEKYYRRCTIANNSTDNN